MTDNFHTKTLRLKLLPVIQEGEDHKSAWKDFRSAIRNISWQVSRVKNRVASEFGLSVLQKREKIESQPVKEYPIGMELLKTIMSEKPDIRIISSRLVSDNARRVRQDFGNTAGKEIFSGKRSIPNYKIDGSIFMGYDGAGAGINSTSGTFRFIDEKTVQIAAYASKRIHPKSVGTTLLLKAYVPHRKWGQREVFQRILSNEYIPISGSIQIDRQDIFLNLNYKFPKKTEQTFINNRIVGFDVGIKKVATCVLSDKPWIVHVIHDEVWKTITDFRARNQRKKTEIGRALRAYNDCQSGHGRKKKTEPMQRTYDKERDFQRLINHRISKAVVNFAKKYGAKYIAMEDLSGIYETGHAPQRMLRRWSYYELQEMVKQKAAESSIEVVVKNAANTTRQCSSCGEINKDNVRNYAIFECVKCNKKIYNGINAAINITRASLAEGKKGNKKNKDTYHSSASSGVIQGSESS